MRTGCDLPRKSKIAVGFEIAVLVFRLQWKVPLAKIAVETDFRWRVTNYFDVDRGVAFSRASCYLLRS